MIRGFSPEVMGLLIRNRWKGNVRELENVVERAVIMARGEVIQTEDLPAHLLDADWEGVQGVTPGRPLSEMEREAILSTLDLAGGNRTETARMLGISRRTLQYKLKEYGVTEKKED